MVTTAVTTVVTAVAVASSVATSAARSTVTVLSGASSAVRSGATLPLYDVYRDDAQQYDACDVRGKLCF